MVKETDHKTECLESCNCQTTSRFDGCNGKCPCHPRGCFNLKNNMKKLKIFKVEAPEYIWIVVAENKKEAIKMMSDEYEIPISELEAEESKVKGKGEIFQYDMEDCYFS